MRIPPLISILCFIICTPPLYPQDVLAPQGPGLSDQDKQRIRMLFESGTAAHDDREYETAVRLLNEALNIQYLPIVAVNLGEAYYRHGDYQLAYDTFQTYLDRAPANDPLRGAVIERIPELEMRLEMASLRMLNWITGILELVSLVIGILSFVTARKKA